MRGEKQLQILAEKIGPVRTKVLAELIAQFPRFYRPDGDRYFSPNHRYIYKTTGITEPQYWEILSFLEKRGFIQKKPKGDLMIGFEIIEKATKWHKLEIILTAFVKFFRGDKHVRKSM